MNHRIAPLPRRAAGALLAILLAATASGQDVTPPAPPPLIEIDDYQKTAEQWTATPARMRGTITGFWNSPSFFLESEAGAVFVSTDEPRADLHIGDSVEVTGLALVGGMSAGLRLQEAHVLGRGAQPLARPLTTAAALDGKNDAHLVRMTGRVAAEKMPSAADDSVLLHADGVNFTAELIGAPDGLQWPALLPGQLVEVTAILSVRGAHDSGPVPFRLLLRSHRDLAAIGKQPWWMPPRLYRMLAAAALLLGAALAWGLALRQQVRRQAEKIRARLERESAVEARYREIFDNAADLILTHDLEGKITSFNAAGERLLGWPAGEITGRNIADLLARDERETSGGLTATAPTIEAESGVPFRLDLLARDGHRVPVEVSSWTAFQDGRPIGRQAICRDLTERLRDEAERAALDHKLQENQKLDSLGILAGGVAHDFNNLLTTILGNASLAQMDSPPNAPAQPCLQQIEIAAERAAGLCQQMLAYSGQGRFVVRRTDLSALVRENADLLRASVSRKAVLDLRLAAHLPATIADATQMHQMLMSLVINAGEALGEKGGTISIATGAVQAGRADFAASHLSPDLPEGEYVFLEVADTGAGISPETRDKIFDPFFSTKFTGRGLGLAAVLGIVRGHRGAIRVTSHPGVGSAFRVLLPSTGMPSLQTELPFPKNDRRAGRVLLVDDEESVRQTVQRMLENLGYEVLTAADGQDAVEQVRQAGPRLTAVLLDLTMPRMDGAEAFHAMHLLQPGLRVLLMSGFAEPQALARFAGLGLTGFLQKPFKPDTLRDKLTAVLSTEPVTA